MSSRVHQSMCADAGTNFKRHAHNCLRLRIASILCWACNYNLVNTMEASANLEALLKCHQAAELQNKILPQKVLQPQQHLSVASAFVSALPLLPLYDLTDASNTATAMAAGQANLPRLPTTSTLELLSYSSADHLLTIPASSNVNIGSAQCKPSNTHHVGHHCHTA